MDLWTSDAVVLEYGMQILRLVGPLWITYVSIEILSASIRGTGDSLIPTLLTLFGVCLLRVVWITLIVPMNRSLSMVMLAYPITWTLTSTLFIIYYRKGHWLERGIARLNKMS